MGRCIIFGAAGFDELLFPMEKDDFVIAADGGLRHLESLGRVPGVVLGDFDSLGYTPADGEVFPVEKDDTDMMLAVRQALQRGYREFLIYGGLDGSRLDHTVANFQTLSYLRAHGARGYLVGKDYLVTVLQNETARFPAVKEGILSVFCMGADATGVTIRGLQYGLEKGTLSAAFPLGVSNHFVGTPAEISVEKGQLLVMWNVKSAFPVIG